MTPRARQIIREVGERRGVAENKIAGKCRSRKVQYARIEVAKRLDACGYSTSQIGRFLNHDHTTICFYLGRGKRRPKPERKLRWRKPRIRHLYYIKPLLPPPPPQARRVLYLIPYAGADMTEYHWKERPHHV